MARRYTALSVYRIDVQGQGFLVADFQDQTALWRAEQALRVSEERLERALAGAGLGTWDWNLQTDEVVYDERLCGMLGYEPGELEGNLDAWKGRVHPEDLPSVEEALRSHFDGETPEYETVHRLLTKTGEWLWAHDRGRVTAR